MNLEKAIGVLKNKGFRLTPQRQTILKFLQETFSHPTASDVYGYIRRKFPSTSFSTVYNTLKTLERLNLVQELKYGDIKGHFDAIMEDHLHLICDGCGKITDFQYSPLRGLEKKVQRYTGFTIGEFDIKIFGFCPGCQARQDTSRKSQVT